MLLLSQSGRHLLGGGDSSVGRGGQPLLSRRQLTGVDACLPQGLAAVPGGQGGVAQGVGRGFQILLRGVEFGPQFTGVSACSFHLGCQVFDLFPSRDV